ncbi:serine/threonine-protein kinase MARK2-like [Ischnura elegans]|uniref:serine/threonine-protein kinase MARK2-like n=1 Tax=Ischnura elegans TaxID=197161 RepID=UPI001ED8AF17|nr:serine/threonine-protein kinase MARK2-like [Ischnura elegans]
MIKVDESDPLGELEPSFPYRDVEIRRGVDVTELYEMQSEIGRGKFGTVYRCREKSTGLQLAAKYVATPRREDRRSVEREVDIMRKLQHPRLIQLYDAFDANGKAFWVILELIEGGELFERVIDDDFILTEKACTVFMRQICEGIEFVHRQSILHLDMKPENILCLTKTGNRIKIIDFGLARKFDPTKKLQVLFGTPEFVAPEVVNFDQIGYGTDMWSVGVICYVLLSGLSPFMGETDVETMANVTIAKYDFEDEAFNEISEDAKDFIKKLLVKDKEVRMSSTQCLEHCWLKRSPPPPPSPSAIIVTPEELDVTKDNLRSFVERWNEHPDSPYVFDTACQSICPLTPSPSFLLLPSPSQHSLRGMSPSPCGSLSSSPDSVLEAETHLPPPHPPVPAPSQTLRPPPDDPYYHYAFDRRGIQPPPWYIDRLLNERRASDSTCIVARKNLGGGELPRVNLVDEIRKLSDRLFQMASRQHIPTNSEDDQTLKVSSPSINIQPHQTKDSTPQVTTNNTATSPQSIKEPMTNNNTTATNNDVPWRRSTFLAGPLNKNSSSDMANGTSKETDASRRPKFKITPFARDVPLASPPSFFPKAQNNSTSSSTPSWVRRDSSSASSDRTDGSQPPSSRWGTPNSTQQPTSTSQTSGPVRQGPSRPIRCPSSSSSSSCSSHSAPHSPVNAPKQILPMAEPDLTQDLLAHLLTQPSGHEVLNSSVNSSTTRTSTTKVIRSEERSRKALSMEWSQVEMTMESLGQRTMRSLAKYFEPESEEGKDDPLKDHLGPNERQTIARNLSQLGV